MGDSMIKASDLFVRCLENEGVTHIFGLPGEENLDVMDSLLGSSIEFITVRHEQGAAFMANMWGRLTRRAGVCLATLGPGATNLMTGVADAQLDLAPVVAIAGQAGTTRLHKESHQVLDLVDMFRPVSKYSTQILEPENIPEIVRKAFKVSQVEKPGVSFIDFPENIAAMSVEGFHPLKVQSPQAPVPPQNKIQEAVRIISEANAPLIMAGNGVIRDRASRQLVAFAERLNIPVATTFMAKGVIPASHPLSLGTIGLQGRDHIACGFDRADVVICVGYDIVEYPPQLWNPEQDHRIVHIYASPAEVDAHYIVEVGVVGNIGDALTAIGEEAQGSDAPPFSRLREIIRDEMESNATDSGFPIKPQKILWDLRQVLKPEDIVISDVGAHKMWVARMYQAEQPNSCIISNGFASMGIAVPGAIAAKIINPDRTVVAVTGDAGFMMNSQELETAMRHNTPFIALIWTDREYGLIKWKQMNKFGRTSHIDFTNPDFIKYAESFGAKGYRVEGADELIPVLKQAIADNTVVLIDCPVDYDENLRLTKQMGEMVCPL